MKTYITLFRGINVGGKNVLPMKGLVSLLKSAGWQNVKTYIQSGNVVADCPRKPDGSIGDLIQATYGFMPEMVAIEKGEFKDLVVSSPFGPENGKAVHFYFGVGKLKPDMGKIRTFLSRTEKFELSGRVFYLYAPDGIGRSKLVSNIDACLGARVTGRNLNTVSKILQLAGNA